MVKNLKSHMTDEQQMRVDGALDRELRARTAGMRAELVRMCGEMKEKGPGSGVTHFDMMSAMRVRHADLRQHQIDNQQDTSYTRDNFAHVNSPRLLNQYDEVPSPYNFKGHYYYPRAESAISAFTPLYLRIQSYVPEEEAFLLGTDRGDVSTGLMLWRTFATPEDFDRVLERKIKLMKDAGGDLERFNAAEPQRKEGYKEAGYSDYEVERLIGYERGELEQWEGVIDEVKCRRLRRMTEARSG